MRRRRRGKGATEVGIWADSAPQSREPKQQTLENIVFMFSLYLCPPPFLTLCLCVCVVCVCVPCVRACVRACVCVCVWCVCDVCV